MTNYTDTLDRARQDAQDVIVQWEGVEFDRNNVRADLDAHWGDEPSAPEGIDESEYRDMVAREISRML